MFIIEIPDFHHTHLIGELENIPNSGGVYAFYSKDKDLLYIGKSTKLQSRVTQHLTQNRFRHLFYTVKCIYTNSTLEQDIFETYLINTLKPIFNDAKVWMYKSLIPLLHRKYWTSPNLDEIIDSLIVEWREVHSDTYQIK